MVSSVINEASRGLQNSQREMLKAAQDVARFNIRPETSSSQETNSIRETAQAREPTVVPPADEATESKSPGNIAEPLVELKRQELIFNASARIISAADRTLGSLLDISG